MSALPHSELQYCVRCCLPETVEGITFDRRGICAGCNSSEQKMAINWEDRFETLRSLADKYKLSANSSYDCIVPISGGKDSCYQLYVVKNILGLNPLAVTFSHMWYSSVGKYNLENALEKFDVDHFMYSPKRSLVNRLARKSLCLIGDSCWHCHAGVGAFPLHVAVKFGIKLLIWGESAAENGTKADYKNPIKFDHSYFEKISAKVPVERVIDNDIRSEEVSLFRIPDKKEILDAEIEGIHLGDYLFWDDERFVDFLKREIDWREDKVEGTYKGYKSVECRMAGVHDYMKYKKRGFGRATDNATRDVRAGILTREEGFELIQTHDAMRPDALDYYMEITGLSEEEIESELRSKRVVKAKNIDL